MFSFKTYEYCDYKKYRKKNNSYKDNCFHLLNENFLLFSLCAWLEGLLTNIICHATGASSEIRIIGVYTPVYTLNNSLRSIHPILNIEIIEGDGTRLIIPSLLSIHRKSLG
jgi:hypothetical protein